jgi:hypothetical protein
VFDVQAAAEDWIVLGRKKGYFTDVSSPLVFLRDRWMGREEFTKVMDS